MPVWLIAAAIATIAVTGALIWMLWRINKGADATEVSREDAKTPP